MIKEVEEYLKEMIADGRCDSKHEQQMRIILQRRFLTKFPHRREKVVRPEIYHPVGKSDYGFPW